MTGLTELNVRNSCDTIPFDIAVTEGAVQFCYFFVMDVIESNWLIDCDLGKNRKESIEDAFCLNAKSIVRNRDKQSNDDERDEKIDPFLHENNLRKQV